MSELIITSSGSGSNDFTPHPEGPCMAVCADVFTKVKPNKYKGQTGNNGKEDTRDTVTSICVSFLTDQTIEIEGKTKPRYASFWATASMGTDDYPSNLRKFLRGWFPALKSGDFERFNAEKLIGRGAYLTIAHSVDQQGKTWANIVGAMTPPKGSPVPAIPADFVRHKDKDNAADQGAPAKAPAKAAAEPIGDDDLPF
jgi:hypothetical protein